MVTVRALSVHSRQLFCGLICSMDMGCQSVSNVPDATVSFLAVSNFTACFTRTACCKYKLILLELFVDVIGMLLICTDV